MNLLDSIGNMFSGVWNPSSSSSRDHAKQTSTSPVSNFKDQIPKDNVGAHCKSLMDCTNELVCDVRDNKCKPLKKIKPVSPGEKCIDNWNCNQQKDYYCITDEKGVGRCTFQSEGSGYLITPSLGLFITCLALYFFK